MQDERPEGEKRPSNPIIAMRDIHEDVSSISVKSLPSENEKRTERLRAAL